MHKQLPKDPPEHAYVIPKHSLDSSITHKLRTSLFLNLTHQFFFSGLRVSVCSAFLSNMDISSHVWTWNLRGLESNLLALDQLEEGVGWPREGFLRLVLQQAGYPRLLPVPSGHPHRPGRRWPQYPDQCHLIIIKSRKLCLPLEILPRVSLELASQVSFHRFPFLAFSVQTFLESAWLGSQTP